MTIKTRYMGLALSLAAASVLTLTGCGGGGSDTPPAAEAAFNGKFIDDAVGGVSFSCAGASGLTAANGSFGTCNAGSTVTFSIGGLVLGSSSATGDGIFFVTDIVEGASRGDIDNEEVLSIASLLQSIDTDGDPSNGITVPPEAAQELADLDVNMSDLSSDEASAITGALAITLNETYPEITYVSPADAEANLAESLERIEDGTIAPPPAPTGSGGGN